MKKILAQTFKVVIMVLALVMIYYELYVDEMPDMSRVAKYISILLVYIMWLLGKQRRYKAVDAMWVGKEFKPVIGEAFSDNKAKHMKLLYAVADLSHKKYKKALKQLERLIPHCANYQDTSAVLNFKALAHYHLGHRDDEVRTYQELLRGDHRNAYAWSNLGMVYIKEKSYALAEEAFENAIAYDDNNPFTYINIMYYCLCKGEYAGMIKFAHKCIELKPKSKDGYYYATIGHAFLSHKEEAEKYLKLYKETGGDGKSLEKQLEKFLK